MLVPQHTIRVRVHINTLLTLLLSKMLVKLVIVLTVLAYIKASPLHFQSPSLDSSQYNMTVVSLVSLEEPCVKQGGICVRVEDCDPSNLVTMSAVLCPRQRHLGIECCYS